MPVAEGFRTWVQFPPPPPFPRPPCGAWISSRTCRAVSAFKERAGTPGPRSLFCGEEIVVRRVVDPSWRPDRGLRAAGLGGDATEGIHALDARDLAERAGRTDGLRGEEQPGDGI